MRALVQRVNSASVTGISIFFFFVTKFYFILMAFVLIIDPTVDNEIISEVGKGICVLVGFSKYDQTKDVDYMLVTFFCLALFTNCDIVINRN